MNGFLPGRFMKHVEDRFEGVPLGKERPPGVGSPGEGVSVS